MNRFAYPVAGLVFAAASAFAQSATTDGEVTKIDKPAARITLRHGEIKNLDMPAMTMVFRVADPKLLETVKVGDRVKFSADKRDGHFTVVTLVKAN